ncbi:hypothetical protein E4T56_gene18877 [Termitomyces sp. T112]|nr:hypothetical protein E4T56_gene18877 [Termitomyces sp. T112]
MYSRILTMFLPAVLASTILVSAAGIPLQYCPVADRRCCTVSNPIAKITIEARPIDFDLLTDHEQARVNRYCTTWKNPCPEESQPQCCIVNKLSGPVAFTADNFTRLLCRDMVV